MPSRFEFERAIRRSDLSPLARLIALTIATWADAETGSIARKNQPAQSVLLEATGMSKSSFLTHRKALLDGGWLRCKSPDKIKAQKEHAQNVYSIHVPDGWARSGDDLAFPGQVGHAPVGARSGGDLAQSNQNGTSPDEARSPGDLGLGREATQPKTDEVGNAPEKLGRLPTTRVLSSSPSLSSIPSTGAERESGNEERIPDAFAYIQPLIQAMTDEGLTVSWVMQADEYQQTAQVLRRAGVTAMVDFALATKRDSRKSIRYATFFLRGGWKGLPPKSTKPRPSKPQQDEKPTYCGDPDCDEITRMRQHEDDNGLRALYPCPDCHPKSRKDTAA
ncbi:hypothetical protein AB0N99_30550 [Streptomyces sp. NPDC093272]|uniref:hypothetical protein n=1 Tax=Streptomyces sp. NPDC093272 TaxID=3154981 RepID=UPI003413ABA7